MPPCMGFSHAKAHLQESPSNKCPVHNQAVTEPPAQATSWILRRHRGVESCSNQATQPLLVCVMTCTAVSCDR
jgi:hypothetical protein